MVDLFATGIHENRQHPIIYPEFNFANASAAPVT